MAEFGSFLNGTLNGAVGSAQGREGTTIETFILSLASGFVLFAVQFGIFLTIRNYLWSKRIYHPRSFLVPVKSRIQIPHVNPLKWLLDLFKIKEDPEVLKKAGLDAYFFLRYLSMCLKLFFPLALCVMPILIPLNAKGGKGTRKIKDIMYDVRGLDLLAWSNVSPLNTNRYWAHLFLAICAVIWVCFTFHQELVHYIKKRHEFLASSAHRLKASSTTTLIMDVPKELCNQESLMDMYGDFPGGIRRIWLNRDFSKLVKMDDLRRYYEDVMENAETNMLRKAIKRNRNARAKEKPLLTRTSTPDERDTIATSSGMSHDKPITREACEADLQYDVATRARWTEYLTPKQRYRMRVPKPEAGVLAKIPLLKYFFTYRVDTIYYCRRQLARLNREMAAASNLVEDYPLNGSVFIQFNTQKAANLACQGLAANRPRYMKERIVEASPADINWDSLNSDWWSKYIRVITFAALYALLIFVFGIIAFFTGILSRISTLAGSTEWLGWIDKLPSWLVSFIQGTLPTFIQIMILSGPTPIVLRAMTNKTRAATTGSQGERSLQLWYFILLLVELFIIPTISSGITSIVDDLIHNPGNVPQILATNLPTASNYFFSFLILQALSLSSTSLLQTVRLFQYYVAGSVNTPDSVYAKLSWTHRTRIGSNIPWYTTFFVIGIVYTIIAPFILILTLITFGLFWMVIKNNLLYVVRTGDVDSGGVWFPSAINQTFTGVYFMEICLVGLFFLVRDENDNVACDAQGIVMAVALAFTILYHIWLMGHLGRLFKFAPIQLESESAKLLPDDNKVEDEHRLSIHEPQMLRKEDFQAHELDEVPSTKEKAFEPVETPSRALSRLLAEETDGASESILSPKKRPTMKSMNSRLSRLSLRDSRDLTAEQLEDAKSAKPILARLNRPLDEAHLQQLETIMNKAETKIGNVLMPRRKDIEAQVLSDPISKIILQHHDELETLDADERDALVSMAFTHPILRAAAPCVWIPTDELGISDDEVRRTKEFSPDINIENTGAFFNAKLKVEVVKPPPDQSEFALVMAEL